MEKIYVYAVSNTSAERIKTELVYALSNTNNVSVKRFIETILGIALEKSNVPEKTYHWNDSIRTLVDFNYIDDRIDYTYKSTAIRYFKDVNDAEKYAKTGEYTYANSSTKESHEFAIEASHTYDYKDCCSVDEWINSKPVNE